jgi:transcriptional regulator with XRE-family HTH domain
MSVACEAKVPVGGLRYSPLPGRTLRGYAVPMNSGESPMMSRRRVRFAVREAREARDLTQSDVAAAMDWSLSKVIRIETGDVTIAPNDLRPLLDYLQVRDRATIDSLLVDAKRSRVRKSGFWWQEAPFKEHLTTATKKLYDFEQGAVAIRFFSIYIVPGPLQTRSFAEAVLSGFDTLTDEERAIRLQSRMRRREDLLSRPDAPKLSVLLDESLVRRPYGGRAVIIEQLSDLQRLAAEGRVDLRIVPFSIDAPLPTYGTYDLLYLRADGDDENAVVYRELDTTDEIIEDSTRAAQYHKKFDELWNASMNETDSIGLISERLAVLHHELKNPT